MFATLRHHHGAEAAARRSAILGVEIQRIP
jgi:hypothetical protein